LVSSYVEICMFSWYLLASLTVETLIAAVPAWGDWCSHSADRVELAIFRHPNVCPCTT